MRVDQSQSPDVLDLTVNQALPLLENLRTKSTRRGAFQDVGLGYIELGQSATTLSSSLDTSRSSWKRYRGGEAGRTLYILDEPTTGLHFADTHESCWDINKLVNQSATAVVIIEHRRRKASSESADYVVSTWARGRSRVGSRWRQELPRTVATSRESYGPSFWRRSFGPHAA